MDENRKKMIIKEILYWKENRMLPEQYCDYLLALYTEGNHSDNEEKEHAKRKPVSKGFLFLLLIPLFVFILYFTELSFDLQMALMTIAFITGFGVTYYFFKKRMQFQVSLVLTALILLLATVEATVHFFPHLPALLYGIVFVNCLLWIIAGKKLKLLYFSISGFLGIGVLFISIIL